MTMMSASQVQHSQMADAMFCFVSFQSILYHMRLICASESITAIVRLMYTTPTYMRCIVFRLYSLYLYNLRGCAYSCFYTQITCEMAAYGDHARPSKVRRLRSGDQAEPIDAGLSNVALSSDIKIIPMDNTAATDTAGGEVEQKRPLDDCEECGDPRDTSGAYEYLTCQWAKLCES